MVLTVATGMDMELLTPIKAWPSLIRLKISLLKNISNN
jgi:hypothetical protein